MASQKDRDLRRIVATRVFRSETGEVIATIFQPVMIRPEYWKCDFRVTGLRRSVDAHGSGEDGMQALTVALQGLRALLEQASEIVTWLDGEPGDFGIPLSIPYGYGPKVEKHLAKVVNDEIARLAKMKWKSKGRR